jgi:hypothetical protein
MTSFVLHLTSRAVVLITTVSVSGYGQGIQWADSFQYDHGGLNPAVAVSSNGMVVEVHNGGAGAGPLWYRVGQRSGSTVQWGRQRSIR